MTVHKLEVAESMFSVLTKRKVDSGDEIAYLVKNSVFDCFSLDNTILGCCDKVRDLVIILD